MAFTLTGKQCVDGFEVTANGKKVTLPYFHDSNVGVFEVQGREYLFDDSTEYNISNELYKSIFKA